MVLGLGYNVAVKRQKPSNASFWSEDICVIYPDLPRQKTLPDVPRFSEKRDTLVCLGIIVLQMGSNHTKETLKRLKPKVHFRLELSESPSVGYPLIDGIVPAVEWSLPDGRPAAPTYPAKLDEVACPACGLARQIVTGAVGIADAYSHCRNLAADQNDVKTCAGVRKSLWRPSQDPNRTLRGCGGLQKPTVSSELATSEVREVIPGSNASKTPDLNLLPIDEDSTTEPVYSSQAGGARLRIEPATSEIKEIIPGSNAFRVPDLNFLPMAQDLTAEPVCSSQAGGTAFTSENGQAVQQLAISVRSSIPGASFYQFCYSQTQDGP
ncbi:hypothetical protein H4Q26_018187 [Puccinia striiformis f. sp. tritici PST-130]|nr:hypothetical protein H4Q26_018187 [Puccinia striiformis f. sp. tritici PST-130]